MPSHSKFAGMVACSAGAYAVSQAFTAVSVPKGAVSPHGTPAAQEVPANAPLQGSFCSAVCALSGSVLAIGASQAGIAASKRRAKVRVMALAQDDEEPAFAPGQQVTLLAPPAMAGKQGTVIGPDLGDTFKVQLASGSIFSIATENIQGAGAPAPAAAAAPVATPAAAPVASFTAPVGAPAKDDEELEFEPGQRVTILAPPALAGKQGTVVGPALGDSFAVQLESGSVFNIATENIQDAAGRTAAPAPAAAPAPFAATASAGQDDEELEFTPGQRVAILAPPAMAGKQGTIVGPALGESFAVQLESGSIFNIATENIQDAAAPAAPRAAAVAAAPMAAAASQDDEELEFTPGQRVTILAPPALAGKPGTIVGPALGDAFKVQLESGSVFNIATENIQDSATPVAVPVAPVATAVSSGAAKSDDEPEFEKGEIVNILAPPALAGKQGTIGGADYADNWMVVLASGSVFSLKAENLRSTTVKA